MQIIVLNCCSLCHVKLKLIYRNWFGWTTNVGGTSGGRMEWRGRRRVTDMLGTGVTSNDRGALAVWRRRATS